MQRSANFALDMGHAHTPPELPEITDEAGDSPTWLPWLGLGLLALSALGIYFTHHHGAEGSEAAAEEAAAP